MFTAVSLALDHKFGMNCLIVSDTAQPFLPLKTVSEPSSSHKRMETDLPFAFQHSLFCCCHLLCSARINFWELCWARLVVAGHVFYDFVLYHAGLPGVWDSAKPPWRVLQHRPLHRLRQSGPLPDWNHTVVWPGQYIIIMYIYHALLNTLSTHIIHILT